MLEQARLDKAAIELLAIIQENPFTSPPRFEKLKGDYHGSYSRRINKQHRIVYDVLSNMDNIVDANGEPYKGIIKVIRMWTHYE